VSFAVLRTSLAFLLQSVALEKLAGKLVNSHLWLLFPEMYVMSIWEQLEILPSLNVHRVNLTSVGYTGVIEYAVLIPSSNCNSD
jgi:uncharacterized membrane protein YidH (DUF202 family)